MCVCVYVCVRACDCACERVLILIMKHADENMFTLSVGPHFQMNLHFRFGSSFMFETGFLPKGV